MSEINLEQTTIEMNENIIRLREELKKESGKNLTLIENLRIQLAEGEKSNQELTLKLQKKDEIEKLNQERMDNLERELKQLPRNAKVENSKENIEKEVEFLRCSISGQNNLNEFCEKNPDFIKNSYNRTNIFTEGGALLFPPLLYNKILEQLLEVSPIRQLSMVLTTSQQSEVSMIYGKYDDDFADNVWVGEGEEAYNVKNTFGTQKIFLKKMKPQVVFTEEFMQDTVQNVETILTQQITKQLELAEGRAFVKGNGIKMPFGIKNNSKINSLDSITTKNIEYGDICRLFGSLKTGYNGIFYLSRQTLTYIMENMVDNEGRPIWLAGNISAGIPSTILGIRYIELPDLDKPVKAGATFEFNVGDVPMLFADLKQGYMVVDKIGGMYYENNNTLVSSGKKGIIVTKRTGGDVMQGEAITQLKIS